MATTIQIPVELKNELDELKKTPTMSYAAVLSDLVRKEKKRKEGELLREYGKVYGAVSRKEVLEWKDEWQ